jgi:hypothetical protein
MPADAEVEVLQSNDDVDVLCKRKIDVGNTPEGMRGESQCDRVPAQFDIRMVPDNLRNASDRIDIGQRLSEIVSAHDLDELIASPHPIQSLKRQIDRFFVSQFHGSNDTSVGGPP